MVSTFTALLNILQEAFVTSYLFTKSDLKTVVIPSAFFAAAAVPHIDAGRLSAAVLWIWLHLLQCDVANQALEDSEDALAKSYRPLPSGRISRRNAIVLRWALVPICFGLSAAYSAETLFVSVALAVATIVYNEFSCHAAHWLIRNGLNAFAYGMFEAGAVFIAGEDRHALDAVETMAVFLSSAIILTTIHAQDFRDEAADRTVGRKTIPIVLPPSIARYTVLVPLMLWSGVIACVWELGAGGASVLLALALFVGGRFVHFTTIPADKISFHWYNVWLTIVHSMPKYYRWYRAGAGDVRGASVLIAALMKQNITY